MCTFLYGEEIIRFCQIYSLNPSYSHNTAKKLVKRRMCSYVTSEDLFYIFLVSLGCVTPLVGGDSFSRPRIK